MREEDRRPLKRREVDERGGNSTTETGGRWNRLEDDGRGYIKEQDKKNPANHFLDKSSWKLTLIKQTPLCTAKGRVSISTVQGETKKEKEHARRGTRTLFTELK